MSFLAGVFLLLDGALVHGIHHLIGQPLIAVGKMDDATIGKALFLDGMLHDVVVLVRVDADIAISFKAEVHDALENAVGFCPRGDSVDDMIG